MSSASGCCPRMRGRRGGGGATFGRSLLWGQIEVSCTRAGPCQWWESESVCASCENMYTIATRHHTTNTPTLNGLESHTHVCTAGLFVALCSRTPHATLRQVQSVLESVTRRIDGRGMAYHQPPAGRRRSAHLTSRPHLTPQPTPQPTARLGRVRAEAEGEVDAHSMGLRGGSGT